MSAPRPVPRTTVGRIAVYTAEMFPPWVMIPGSCASFLAIYGSLVALAGESPIALGWRTVAGAATVLLFSLLLRVYDELKDVETDLRLGRAGDPRYANRAIVTGRVTERDLIVLRWFVVAALILLNLGLGWPWPGLAFVATYAATWLSLKWFFWPRMRQHLLVAFVTHNPLSILLTLYVVALHHAEHPGPRFSAPMLAALVVGHWGPVAAWEIARKVRAPEEETDYITYSRILGARFAAALPVVFVMTSLAGLALVARRIGAPQWYFGVLLCGALPLALSVLRFEAAPSPRTSRLMPMAETYAAAVWLGTSAMVIAARGIVWVG